MRRNRNTKIIATLGPASSDPTTIEKLLHAGADAFRLNFSHGDHADHRATMDTIRAIEEKSGRPIGVLMDLQGPKLRVGRIEGGSVEIENGSTIRLDMDDRPGDGGRFPLLHPEIYDAVAEGDMLLLDDGKLRLGVRSVNNGAIDAEVLNGGTLSERKGVNLPGTILPISAITEKDHKDLEFGLTLGADWVALSFVQRPEDIAEARAIIGDKAAIMAKLEKPSAITSLQEIVEQADGIMVARGDLGVELPPEDVPPLQKRIVRACRHAGKPVVVATQMLDSMVHSPTPTRAEASDVATAVYDGADCVMLSAETAAGDYPVETVEMMNRIIERTESDQLYRQLLNADQPVPEPTAPDAITKAAGQVAGTIGAAAIVTYSVSGSTTQRGSRERPSVPILGLTPRLSVARKTSLLWGVHSATTPDASNFRDMVIGACDIARRDGFEDPDAPDLGRIVITAGVPFGTPGATNILRIAKLNDPRG